MIVLIGNRLKLGGIAEVFKNRLKEEICFINEQMNILNQENDLLAIKNVSYMVYDVEQYFNDAEQIIEVMKRIKRVNNAKIILYTPTENPKNEIIKYALINSIRCFINSLSDLSTQKDELEKIIVGFYEVNHREDIKAAEEELEKETKTLNSFVEELYDAKKREIQKEKTIIVNKKTNFEVFLFVIAIIFRVFLSIVLVTLISIAVIVLLYSSTRFALFEVLKTLLKDIFSIF